MSAKIGDYGNSFIQNIATYAQNPDGLVSKQALCCLFECSGRTIQRMVARRVLPPPLAVAGKKMWNAETLGKWLAGAASRRQAAIEAEARRLRAISAKFWDN